MLESNITHLKSDVLMIGSGISGLYCALKLAEQGQRVLIVTKNALTENNSRYAQGGIAAVLPQSDDDSIAAHLNDTLVAGAGLCIPDVAQSILADAHEAIADLLLLGVPFDKNECGELALTLEGGHCARRIIHAGGDATGKQVEMTLIRHVEQHANIRTIEHCQVVQLLTREDGSCMGADAVVKNPDATLRLMAKTTILATGGAGRLFAQTTNPKGATGNGFVLAYQAGATLMDMEMIQFHPTAFIHDGEAKFLVSEALRGEGGRLIDHQGHAFVADYDERGDLAPRDVVSRAIDQQLKKQARTEGAPDDVRLDVSHLPDELIESRFPTILNACERFGVDIRTQPIPVAPAAHYMMGGIKVNADGWTGVNGLYAIGETVWTGLHGANRLASNSLLECMVVAKNAAAQVAVTTVQDKNELMPNAVIQSIIPFVYTTVLEKSVELEQSLRILHQQLSHSAGIVRSADTVASAIDFTEASIAQHFERMASDFVVPADIEYVQQLILCRIILKSVLERQESRGAHYRSDYPHKDDTLYHTEAFLNADGRLNVSRKVFSSDIISMSHSEVDSEQTAAQVAVS